MPSRSNVYFWLGAVLVAALLIAGAVHNHKSHKQAPASTTVTAQSQTTAGK